MKKFLFTSLSIISLAANAGTMGEVLPSFPWFGSIGTGYSWSEKPGISNPDPNFWDSSNEGYNGDLTNSGFYSFAIGKQVHQYIDLSVSYLNNEDFEFQHVQTGSGNTPGFTGSNRTRFFTLNNRSLLANIIVHNDSPLITPYSINLTPFVSGGIGVGFNRISNFHTVGTVVLPTNSVGSTTSIGNPVSKTSFAWQGSAGINIQPTSSHLSANLGYRYYDGGNFEGPGVISNQNDGWSAGAPWKGSLIANQIFVEFKYTA